MATRDFSLKPGLTRIFAQVAVQDAAGISCLTKSLISAALDVIGRARTVRDSGIVLD